MNPDNLNLTPAALIALGSGDFTNAVIAATPGGIERQEAEGQRQMASSFRTLPKDMDRAPAETFGFKFGEDADDIFVNVIAPEGWSIRPTEHSMWSDIIDDKGRKRGSIFYKAAFYDRNAHGSWECRYRVENEYGAGHRPVEIKAVDTATGELLFSETVPPGDDEGRYEREDAAGKVVADKLAERFPDYRDVTAYWND